MSNYKEYPRKDIFKNLATFVQIDKQEIVLLEEEWAAVEKHNNEEYAKHQKVVADFINEYKAKYSDLDIKFKNGKFRLWFEKQLNKAVGDKFGYFNTHRFDGRPTKPSYPSYKEERIEVYGISFNTCINFSPTTLTSVHTRMRGDYESKKQEMVLQNKLLLASMKWAITNNFDVDGLSPSELIHKVDEENMNRLKQDYEINNSVGTQKEIYFDGCDTCSLYFYGDHRCSCGNRRVSCYPDGNIINGYYMTTEAY